MSRLTGKRRLALMFVVGLLVLVAAPIALGDWPMVGGDGNGGRSGAVAAGEPVAPYSAQWATTGSTYGGGPLIDGDHALYLDHQGTLHSVALAGGAISNGTGALATGSADGAVTPVLANSKLYELYSKPAGPVALLDPKNIALQTYNATTLAADSISNPDVGCSTTSTNNLAADGPPVFDGTNLWAIGRSASANSDVLLRIPVANPGSGSTVFALNATVPAGSGPTLATLGATKVVLVEAGSSIRAFNLSAGAGDDPVATATPGGVPRAVSVAPDGSLVATASQSGGTVVSRLVYASGVLSVSGAQSGVLPGAPGPGVAVGAGHAVITTASGAYTLALDALSTPATAAVSGDFSTTIPALAGRTAFVVQTTGARGAFDVLTGTAISVPAAAATTGIDGGPALAGRTIVFPANAGLNALAGSTPTFSISAGSPVVEGDTGTQQLTYTVTLSTPVVVPTTVTAATTTGTATAGSDYTPKVTALQFAPGDTSKTFSVDVKGDDIDENDETVVVELSNATGGPTLGTASATGTILDDDDPSVYTAGDATVIEGTGLQTTPATVTITRTDPGSAGSVTVSTADGTATAPDDYVKLDPTVVDFAAGEASKTVTVQVVQDDVVESAETFGIVLTNVTGGGNPQTHAGTVTITDDDQPQADPKLSIGDVTVPEGTAAASQPTLAQLTVTLNRPVLKPVTFKATTVDGTATAGDDYAAGALNLTIPAQKTTAQVTVQVVPDAIDEDDEAFTVHLSDATSGIGLDKADGTVTIQDDDTAQVAIGDARATEGGPLVFPVILTTPSAKAIDVPFATGDQSALAPQDYTAVQGSVTFPAGATSGTIAVPTVNDTLPEPNETMTASIGAPATGNPVLRRTGIGTILDDDRVLASPYTTRLTSKVSLKSSPKRDRKRPFKFKLSGRVSAAGAPAGACAKGFASLRIRSKSKVIATKRVAVRAGCTFAGTVTVKSKKPAKLTAEAGFLGTTALKPSTSKRLKIQTG